MSDYKRLISYVYMYLNKEKGRNVGFVKLETRNGQCKIGISLKGIPSGNMDMEVFLFAHGKEISVGKIYIRNGQGESRIVTDYNNLVGSGVSLAEMGGLRVVNRATPDVTYATIWDDALVEEQSLKAAEAAEVLLEEAIEEVMQEPAAAVVPAKPVEGMITSTESAAQYMSDIDFSAARPYRHPAYGPAEILEFPEQGIQAGAEEEPEMNEPGENPQEAENIAVEPEVSELAEEPEGNSSEGEAEPQDDSELWKKYREFEEALDPSSRPPEIQMDEPQNLWEVLEKKFPKAKCVATDVPHEILTIQPQDIGLLPRETWVFGNNSFLLHGYYQYRYLILIRMKMEENRERYLIGVPGVYHNNERFMATMFGFPSFYMAKRQQSKTGQFGYWCTEIKLG